MPHRTDELAEMIRRNAARLDRIEAKLGLKADRIEQTVEVHDEEIKGIWRALEAHHVNQERHRPAQVPPLKPEPPEPVQPERPLRPRSRAIGGSNAEAAE